MFQEFTPSSENGIALSNIANKAKSKMENELQNNTFVVDYPKVNGFSPFGSFSHNVSRLRIDVDAHVISIERQMMDYVRKREKNLVSKDSEGLDVLRGWQRLINQLESATSNLSRVARARNAGPLPTMVALFDEIRNGANRDAMFYIN